VEGVASYLLQGLKFDQETIRTQTFNHKSICSSSIGPFHRTPHRRPVRRSFVTTHGRRAPQFGSSPSSVPTVFGSSPSSVPTVCPLDLLTLSLLESLEEDVPVLCSLESLEEDVSCSL
jgi:hypothetical protein